MKKEQKQLNDDIAQELDKYQIILEYGRVMLGESDEIKKKYRWITDLNNGAVLGFVADILLAIVGSVSGNHWLFVIFAIITLFLLIYMFLRYRIRKEISHILSPDKEQQLQKLLNGLNGYLSNLAKWLRAVNSHIKADDKTIELTNHDFETEKPKQESQINEISNIYGKLNPEWEKRAIDFAEKRLEEFKRYRYAQEF